MGAKKKKKVMYVTTKNAGNQCSVISPLWIPLLFHLLTAMASLLPFSLPSSEFDRHEILLYEEVAKVPAFKRKTLILIGAQGVGRRRLMNKLLLRDPLLFGATIPCRKTNQTKNL